MASGTRADDWGLFSYRIDEWEPGEEESGAGREVNSQLVNRSVARWQHLIPSFPWIVPGWSGILQRSVAEP